MKITRRTMNRLLATVAATALLLAGCGGTDTPDAGEFEISGDDVDLLGGQQVTDELTSLYEAATEAGQSTVTVYGPGENDRGPVYDIFAERFPGITVKGEFLIGSDLVSRVNQEFASGKHAADVMQNGDTTAAAQINDQRFEKFVPVSAKKLDPSYTDGNGLAHAASALAFGPAYNVDQVEEGDIPASWEDLLDSQWSGRLVMDDPSSSGAAASTLSHLLWDDRYDESFAEQLAGQEPRLVENSQAAGTSAATGEYDMTPIYPYSFFLRAKEQGAPMEFVFPLEGGNHTSPHFLSLSKGAPNPEAAKLFITWMFTPEAQNALAEVGQWGTMPDAPGPDGYPALSELDLLKPFPLDQVGQINNDSIAFFEQTFS